MPQDVPLEASSVLAFTPPSLAEIENPPKFRLRAATWREKSFRTDLLREHNAARYDEAEMRAETLRGLKELWGTETYDEQASVITGYWKQVDDFALQQKDDPDLVWEYDAAKEKAIAELLDDVHSNWRPLGRMVAKSAKFSDLFALFTMAATIITWDGIDLKREIESGYLSLDCADAIGRKLFRLAQNAGVQPPQLPALELLNACYERFSLGEEEVGNSASPSPSETIPQASPDKPAKKAGRSPASATSPKTREPA